MKLYIYDAKRGDLQVFLEVVASNEAAALIAVMAHASLYKTLEGIDWAKIKPTVVLPGEVIGHHYREDRK